MRRGLSGGGLPDLGSRRHRGAVPVPTRYPEEFRRKRLSRRTVKLQAGQRT